MMFNRYGYASNNQYMYVDPDGKEGKSSLSIGVAAAAYTDLFAPDPSDVAAPVKIAAYGAALVGTVIVGAISLGLVRTILNLQRIMR